MQMPQIEWPGKTFEEPVTNKRFLEVKVRQVENLLYRLRGYVDQLTGLNGLRGRDDIIEVVWFVLREFSAYLWDLPASRSYHHSERWGLLRHSLEVALSRAEEASQRIAVDSQGNPSAEAGRKHRGEQVLIAWLSGLFHDSGKIFDMDIVYSDPESNHDIYYHPFRGNVLGFKLKHPEKNIKIYWRDSRGMRHARRNLAMFMNLVPLELLKQLRQEQLIALFDGLIEDGDIADQESVADYRSEQDTEYVSEAIKLFARDGFRAADNKGRMQPRVFAVGQNTYALINPVVPDTLARYIQSELGGQDYTKEQVINYLIRNRLIYTSTDDETSGNYFIKLTCQLKDISISSHIILAHGDMFADVDVSTVPVLKFKDSEDARGKISRLTGFEPPEEWFYAE